MKRYLVISILAILAVTVYAQGEPAVVDGVTYEWYTNDLTHQYGYIAAGWDEQTPIQSLHIHSTINDGYEVLGIKNAAFQDNTDIVYLTIDEGLTFIGENAFSRCTNLKVAILPEGLESIREEAFAYCTGLSMMVIPSTVTDIQSHAFAGCTGVTDVYFLMTGADQLQAFDWWDGKYHEAPQEAGGMEFNTNAHTTVHLPAGTYDTYLQSGKLEAWLQAAEEDDNSYPLWWIVNYGVVGHDYTVSDDLAAIFIDKNGSLYAKDAGHWLTPDKAYPGETDYMLYSGLMNNHGNEYDQSNWVMLTHIGDGMVLNLKGSHITGGTITGTLIDKKNPTIQVSSEATLEKGDPATFTPNIYIAAAFMGRTQMGSDGKTYAFVQPKPQELIHMVWAIYNDNDQCFYLPKPEDGINTKQLVGGVAPCFDLNEEPEPQLVDGSIYVFDAINRRIVTAEQSRVSSRLNAPYTDGGKSDTFIVYPIQLPDEIITGQPDMSTSLKHHPTCWYSIDGFNLGTSRPTTPGLYINGTQKVVVQ